MDVERTLSREFSRTQNTPRTSREGNQMIFSKEEQTIVSFWRFFQETKEKLDVFKLKSIPNTLNYSLKSGRVVLYENQPVF